MKSCAECSESFSHTHNLQRYCGDSCRYKAQWKRRNKAVCVGCGNPTGYAASAADGHLCQACRRMKPGYRMPSGQSVFTWVCGGCGVACIRRAVKGQKPKWCGKCRKALQNRDIKITPSERVDVYVRDAWVCWLCEDAVDRSLIGTYSHWRPSLDHVVTRSSGGSDSISNLRLAHWWCNSVRSDGRKYSPEDFRVSN
jgi:hypothetical protein